MKLVYTYIETVSLEDTHLDLKPELYFIWKVNYCHCYLCSPYLRRHVNINRIETSFLISTLNIEAQTLYVFYLCFLTEHEYNFYHV